MSRRSFIHGAAAGTALAFPSIVPARVLGANAPSNTLNVAQIGCGRIGRTMDAPGFMHADGARMTASDPVSPGRKLKALDASDPALIAGKPSVVLYPHFGTGKKPHHQNLVDAIKGDYESLVPAETAHRSCSACLLSRIGMKLGRKLEWDWKKEQFVNDAEANAMLEREERAPYGAKRAYQRLSKKA